MLDFLKTLLINIVVAIVMMAILALFVGSILYLLMSERPILAAALFFAGVGLAMTAEQMSEDDEAA